MEQTAPRFENSFDLDEPRFETPARTEEPTPIPRISIQIFCETPEVTSVMETAAGDRRMAKAHTKIHMGGILAATEFYKSAPTPNLIVVESRETADEMLASLESLAEVCDSGTKVIVLGRLNDVHLYRELIGRGVAEYLVVPFALLDFLGTVSRLYHNPETGPLGKTIAFIGARGGCGSSTVAHNVAYMIAQTYDSDVVLADMDLAFGTAGLDFNQDPPQGIAEAVFSPDRIDDVFLDRLLTKCTDRLSLLAAPSALDRTYDFEEKTFEALIDTASQGVPSVILDLPHAWTSWVRHTLSGADEIVITASPDLGNLRNAKNLIDFLKAARPNDMSPRLVLNQVGIPKRPEIKPEEFAHALELEPVAIIPFDAHLFGTAANNGQMIAELDGKGIVTPFYAEIAQTITGRGQVQRSKKSVLAPILEKLRGQKG
ncbi:MAG: CpaE family protein [Pseudomonadota bacterium]